MLNFFASFFTNDKTFLDAVKGGSAGFVRRLLAAGANPNAADKDGDTALVVAVKANHAEVVKTLLGGGADPHYGNDDLPHPRSGGDTSPALLWAVMKGKVKISEMLLDADADADSAYGDGFDRGVADYGGYGYGMNWTVLKEATHANNVDLVDILLHHGADTNIDEYSDDEFISPLYLAVKRGNADIAERLLDAGADPNKMGAYGAMDANGIPLFCAVREDNFEMGKLLLRYGADPNADQYSAWTLWDDLGELDNNTPNRLAWEKLLMPPEKWKEQLKKNLLSAAKRGKVHESRRLIAEGVDVNSIVLGVINREGDTPLSAAAAGGYSIVVKALLDARANPNTTTTSGWTALMRAAEKGHVESALVLLGAGANLEKMDMSDLSALVLAAKNGHDDMVEILLNGGANPHATDKGGNTALDYAKERKHHKMVNLLKFALAPPKRQENNKKGEWFYTVDFGDESEVQLLLDEGADVNETGGDGNTALMTAARCGRLEILKLLMSGKAKLNLADNNGMTALMQAASNGHAEIVKVLLDAGAKPDIADKDEKTAWDIARARGYAKVAKTLQDGGADPFAGKDDVGFVYLAINESMPGLVKIGMTKVDVDERIKELSRTTSVPTPFECAYSVKVVSPKQVEESLHEKYDFCRVRGEREFFKIDWRAVELYLEEKYSLLSHSRESGNLPNL